MSFWQRTSINLGAEYDDALFASLVHVLRDEGAVEISKKRWIVGSQDLTRWKVRVAGKTITIVRETYAGLIIRGPKHVIERLAARVKAAGDPSQEEEPGK